jgi:hypothetical protein
MRLAYFLLMLVITIMSSCRDPYDAGVRSAEQSFLVVEANLNTAADSTVIRLTRSFKLDESAKLRTENGATVSVEGKDNTTRPLTGTGNGYYVSRNLSLAVGTEYRLRIRTSNGSEYISDYVKARVTPPIDSISWQASNEGVRIFANTHDPSGNSKYYRWDFDETWEIRSKYYSNLIYDQAHDTVIERILPAQEIFYCWKYDTSKTILLANSTRLQEDKIFMAPLHLIPRNSEKLSVRYSINVRQYALDREAYNFYELMKKNTEEIGSLFTAQPFELQGNMHCVNDPEEYVLGYVTASSKEVKRIFVNYSWPFYEECYALRVYKGLKDSIKIYFGNGGGYIPYDYDFVTSEYLYSQDHCVDCQRRKGNLTKPSFW